MGTSLTFSSSRIVFASCAMPAFVCPYAAYFFVAPPSLPAPSMLNMCPSERSSLWRFIVMIAWRVHKMDPSELVVTTSAIVAGSASSRFSYRYPLLPALLIHRSTPPKTFTTSSAKAATEDASPTFEGCPWTTAASPKRDRRSATVARTFSASRDVMKTPSPRLKNARASARPKPFVLPVMTTRCFAPAAPAAGGGGGSDADADADAIDRGVLRSDSSRGRRRRRSVHRADDASGADVDAIAEDAMTIVGSDDADETRMRRGDARDTGRLAKNPPNVLVLYGFLVCIFLV